MSWDDDDDNSGGFRWISWTIGGSAKPEPMTAAGRFLRGLDNGDTRFKSNDESISEELLCALRRIELKTKAGVA